MVAQVPERDVVSAFTAALEELNCLVLRADAEAAADTLIAFLQERRIAEVVAWSDAEFPGLPLGAAARAAGIAWHAALPGTDPARYREEAARAGAGVTGVAWAIAETGTLVLMSGPGRPRSASLLPPVHIAVVRREQILGSMTELFSRLGRLASTGGLSAAVNLVTGASRTADIEHVLVRKVHGPGEVAVLLV